MNVFQQIAKKDKNAFRTARRQLQVENLKYGDDFQQVSEEQIRATHEGKQRPVTVFRNRHFLAAIYMDDCDGIPYVRMAVNRTELTNDGHFRDGITWEELMRVKAGIGMTNEWMVEVYPPDAEVVNVGNMRHLFVVPQPPFAWVRHVTPPPAKCESLVSQIIKRFRRVPSE